VDAGRAGHVFEGPVTLVAIEDVLLALVGKRSRKGFGGIEVTVFGVEHQISADIQIEQSVTIEIEERGTEAPQLTADSGLLGDVREGSVAVVEVEAVAAVVGDEEIPIAVIVVVGGNRGHAEPRVSHTRLFGDVGEGGVAVVAIERVFQLASEVATSRRAHRLEVASVDQVDVEIAVVVVIRRPRTRRYSRAHRHRWSV